MSDPVYQSVLDFFRASIRDVRLYDTATPMPPLLSLELKAAAELVDKQPPGDPSQDEALRLAVTQYAERILFIDHSNYYRILGLNRDADTAQIKDHYKWLSRLMFPVGDMVHWNEADGELLNRAYSVLREPKSRKAYDEELVNKSDIDNTTGVKREVTARAGSGRGSVAEAVASVPGQAQIPAEGGLTPEQAPAHPRRGAQGSSYSEANKHRVKPTPSARVETARSSRDLMLAAAMSSRSASKAIPETDGGAFPSPAKTVKGTRGSRDSLAVKIAIPIAVGLAVLVYLDVIPLSFIDDRVEIRPPPVTTNIPPASETGEIIARSDSPIQGLDAGDNDGLDAALKPPDAISDLHDGTPEPATTDTGSELPDLSAAPDAPVAAAPPPDALTAQHEVTPAATQAPAVKFEPAPPATAPLSSRVTKREGTAAPPQDRAQPTHAEQVVSSKPAAPSVPPPAPVKSAGQQPSPPSLDVSSHPATGSVAATQAPAKEIKAAPVPPATAPLSSRVTNREGTTTPLQDKTKPAHTEQVSKPAASSVPLPSPVKSAGEQPSLSGEKLAKAAPQLAPPLNAGDSSSSDQSNPASPLQAVNEHHLESLVKTFITSYEAGDTDIFMSLLSDDAHTKSQRDRESIRIAYNQLFQGTRNRRLKLQELEWTPAENDTLIGRAPFLLTLIQEGQKKPLRFSGTLVFHVKNSDSHLLITQFDYEYKGNK